MKIVCITGLFVLAACHAFGQLRPLYVNPVSESSYLSRRQGTSIFGRWRADQQTYYRYASPRMTVSPVNANGYSYWLGSTTTQSFNNGKFGTIYFYDMMGNMQYSRAFIDIAGKNRRGIKLLLPTLNQRMFVQR